MDDEKYYVLTGYQMSGNINFYSSDPTQTPIEVKNSAKSKFEPNVLLWIPITDDGISSPTILTGETGINTDVYISTVYEKGPYEENIYEEHIFFVRPLLEHDGVREGA